MITAILDTSAVSALHGAGGRSRVPAHAREHLEAARKEHRVQFIACPTVVHELSRQSPSRARAHVEFLKSITDDRQLLNHRFLIVMEAYSAASTRPRVDPFASAESGEDEILQSLRSESLNRRLASNPHREVEIATELAEQERSRLFFKQAKDEFWAIRRQVGHIPFCPFSEFRNWDHARRPVESLVRGLLQDRGVPEPLLKLVSTKLEFCPALRLIGNSTAALLHAIFFDRFTTKSSPGMDLVNLTYAAYFDAFVTEDRALIRLLSRIPEAERPLVLDIEHLLSRLKQGDSTRPVS